MLEKCAEKHIWGRRAWTETEIATDTDTCVGLGPHSQQGRVQEGFQEPRGGQRDQADEDPLIYPRLVEGSGDSGARDTEGNQRKTFQSDRPAGMGGHVTWEQDMTEYQIYL